MTRARTITACNESVTREYQGAFAAMLPPTNLEPIAFRLWQAADRLSLAEASELAPHYQSIIEARDKLNLALCTFGEAK